VYTWHAPEQLRNSLTVYFTSPYFLCGSGFHRFEWQPAQSGLYVGERQKAASVFAVWHRVQVSATPWSPGYPPPLVCRNVLGDHAVVVWQLLQSKLLTGKVMCAVDGPLAVVPLWQVRQPLVTPEWSNAAGSHASVEWQSPHCAVVGMWLVGRPGAWTPSWQLLQVPLTWLWSTRTAGFQAVTVWQLSQLVSLAMCVLPLPIARVPSWQEKHVPMTCMWSTRVAGRHAVGVWQDSQALLVARWDAPFPVAFVPSWQPKQLPVTPSWLKPVAGTHAAVPWQLLHSAVVAMCVAGLPGARAPL
jgi:hypothetical protein